MGVFISLCPECLSEIEWFINPPQDYVCRCGRAVTPEEIEYSGFHQVHQGGNQERLKNLEKLTREEISRMLERSKEGGYVRSPREEDDFYFSQDVLELALEIKELDERENLLE